MSVSEMNVGQIRRSLVFMRAISCVVLITFASVTISPGAQAIAQTVENATSSPPVETTGNPHADKLEQVKGKLRDVSDKRAKGQSIATEKAALRELRSQLKALDSQTLAEFDTVEQHIKDKNLPDVILQRHRDAVQKFKEESAKTDAELADLDSTSDETAVATKSKALSDRLEGIQTKRRHQPFDPNNLPFRASDRKPIPPRTKLEEFSVLFPLEPVDGVRLASTSPFSLLPALQAAVGVPGPEYLAATEDVQITQEIRDLAAALNNNPVEIYNWVRDNIEYLPTYGSIQGSDLTLLTRRGNAFDTSSLLIALLRAAGIPARYGYGTVEVPIDKVMNWVGDVTVPSAAINLLAQGGVPVTGLAQGGVIRSARMEHVWVEAFVDIVPSRGTKNRIGDTWVPMDASFKQYTYSPGINMASAVPGQFDQYGVLTDGGSVDVEAGVATNLNVVGLQSDLVDYQLSVAEYIAGLGNGLTEDQLLGSKKTKSVSAPTLPISLPYRVTVRASVFASIPSSMKHSIQVTLFNSRADQQLDSPSVTREFPLAKIAGKRLGVTYKPATAADASVIERQSQTGATRLPAYLIRVIPVIQLDGTDVAAGPAVGMGQDNYWRVTLRQPGEATAAHVHTYSQIAGDEIVFGVNGNGITESVARSRIAVSPATTSAESLHQVALYYWIESDLLNHISSQRLSVVEQRLPSVGLFSSPLTVQYSYGLPRHAFYKSRVIDISRSFVAAVERTALSAKNFVMISGIQSSILESRVLEQLTGSPLGSGNSAVQLLIDAADQGIPLYTVSATNSATILPGIDADSELVSSVSNAVKSGKLVLISERAPDKLDSSGMGYVVLDPDTGGGAYLIEGNLNGGELAECVEQTQPLAQAIADIAKTLLFLGLLAVAIAAGVIIIGGSGGVLVPATIALIALGVGLTAFTWPKNALANSCDKGCHHGRLQAQGGSLQKSVNWNQATSLTLSQGLALLAQLAAKLTVKELAERAAGFLGAERFMRNAAAGGGVCAGDIPNSLSFPPGMRIRVDIEVRGGRAFTPDPG